MTETTTKPGSEDAGESTQRHATAPKPDTKPDGPWWGNPAARLAHITARWGEALRRLAGGDSDE